MDTTVYIGRIHIIEWLGPRDVKTGWALYNELQPLGIVSQPQVDVVFRRVANRDEFIAYVHSVSDDLRTTGQLPLLHIETHGVKVEPDGGPHGIGASSTDYVLWPELMKVLIPLNRLTGLRLVVVLAACEGFWGIKMLDPTDRAAFLMMLGPNDKIDYDRLATGLQAFYRIVFATGNGNIAYDEMNTAVGGTEKTFLLITAERAFRMVFREFLRKLHEPGELARRVEATMSVHRWRYFFFHGRTMPLEAYERTLAVTRAYTENNDQHFDRFRRNYFFIDLFPQNDRRFSVALRDCLQEYRDEHGGAGA